MTGSGRMSRFGLFVVVVLCCIVFAAVAFLAPDGAVRIATSVLLLYVLFTRLIFTGDHQLALWHLAHHEYEEAIERLEASRDYFERRRWLDVVRFFLLLSPTAYRYHEMALLGLGYCHAQLGHLEARDHYLACLKRYPDNTLARAALVLMQRGADLARPELPKAMSA